MKREAELVKEITRRGLRHTKSALTVLPAGDAAGAMSGLVPERSVSRQLGARAAVEGAQAAEVTVEVAAGVAEQEEEEEEREHVLAVDKEGQDDLAAEVAQLRADVAAILQAVGALSGAGAGAGGAAS